MRSITDKRMATQPLYLVMQLHRSIRIISLLARRMPQMHTNGIRQVK